MKGRKPDLNKGAGSNVVGFPGQETQKAPLAVHYEQAEELRPASLKGDEIEAWNRLAPELIMLGRLKPHFVDAFAEYCIVRTRIAAARQQLDEQEWTYFVEGRNGRQIKSRPEVAQLNDDWRKWRTLVGEFGLAPAAERGMRSGQGDLFDDFDSF